MTDSSENTRNFYRQQGAAAEQARIINLLFDRKEDGKSWVDLWVGCGCCSQTNDDEILALIKGEK